jgi:hypothetical protein
MRRTGSFKQLAASRAVTVAVLVAIALATLGVGMIARQGGAIAAAHAGETVDCRTLATGVLAGLDPMAIQEHSSMLDREAGTIRIELYGIPDRVMTVSSTDPVCLADPVIGPIIARHVENARVDLLTECADLTERVASGRVVLRGRELDIDKVRAHVDRWC